MKSLVSLVAVMALMAALCTGQIKAQSETINEGAGASGQGGGLFGMLGTLVSPLCETLRATQRMFGLNQVAGKVENFVEEGFNQVQAQAFNMFMRMYNKTYLPSEIPKRMALFFERRKSIQESLRAFSEGRLPFAMRENSFIDWTENELKQLARSSPPVDIHDLYPEEKESILEAEGPASAIARIEGNSIELDHFGPKSLKSSGGSDDKANFTVKADKIKIPISKDWRESSCVDKPIDQGRCGCCYAVATMNTVETARCLHRSSSPTLSYQQIVDCSTPRAGYNNFGCNGGWPTRALKYLQDTNLIARQKCYPFIERQGICRLNSLKKSVGCTHSPGLTDSGLKFKILHNEVDILYHVANTGPVITAMNARDSFLYYGSGIYDDTKCSNREYDVNHAISIVGYGRENGIDYWLIKNSWGTDWGLGGFGKYRRGKNACSIGHWGWVILP